MDSSNSSTNGASLANLNSAMSVDHHPGYLVNGQLASEASNSGQQNSNDTGSTSPAASTHVNASSDSTMVNSPYASAYSTPSSHDNAQSPPLVVASNSSAMASMTTGVSLTASETQAQSHEDTHTDQNSPSSVHRIGQPISAENAQAYLPPSSCVFVANLSSSRTDEELQQSVERVFREYGNVYVKIRRDGRGMPYAFCQYENDDDSRRAILGARRQIIDGRPCRTEPARVYRSGYLTRVTGGHISEDEARKLLSRFGPLDNLWYSSDTEREIYQLGDGIWAKFSYYQDCRDAAAAIRTNPRYHFYQPTGIEPPRLATHRSPTTRNTPTQGTFRDGSHLVISGQSIFIGNLPLDMTRGRIEQAFRRFGTIVNTNLVTKSHPSRGGTNSSFAFVDFAEETAVVKAIDEMDQSEFYGNTIRVEAKTSRAFGSGQATNGSSGQARTAPRPMAMTAVRSETGIQNQEHNQAPISPASYGANGTQTPYAGNRHPVTPPHLVQGIPYQNAALPSYPPPYGPMPPSYAQSYPSPNDNTPGMETVPVQGPYPANYYMPGYGMQGFAATFTPQQSPSSANGIYGTQSHVPNPAANGIFAMTPQASPTSAGVFAASAPVSPTTANPYYPYGMGQFPYGHYHPYVYYPQYALQYAAVNGVPAVNPESASGQVVETPMNLGQQNEGNGEHQS